MMDMRRMFPLVLERSNLSSFYPRDEVNRGGVRQSHKGLTTDGSIQVITLHTGKRIGIYVWKLEVLEVLHSLYTSCFDLSFCKMFSSIMVCSSFHVKTVEKGLALDCYKEEGDAEKEILDEKHD